MHFVRGFYIVFSCAVLFAFAPGAHADVIFTDLGPSNTFDDGTAFGFGPTLFTGSSFTPTLTGSLNSLELALSTQSALSDTSGTDVILTDTGLDGKPDNVLETFLTGTIPGDDAPALITLASVDHPVLTAGVQYFIIIGGGPAGGWFYSNSIGDAGPVVNGVSSSHFNLFSADESAFEVDGTPLSSVPEPRAGLFVGLGLLGIIWARTVRAGGARLRS